MNHIQQVRIIENRPFEKSILFPVGWFVGLCMFGLWGFIIGISDCKDPVTGGCTPAEQIDIQAHGDQLLAGFVIFLITTILVAGSVGFITGFRRKKILNGHPPSIILAVLFSPAHLIIACIGYGIGRLLNAKHNRKSN